MACLNDGENSVTISANGVADVWVDQGNQRPAAIWWCLIPLHVNRRMTGRLRNDRFRSNLGVNAGRPVMAYSVEKLDVSSGIGCLYVRRRGVA